ncbi:MAG: M55 family metallopeptidase [Proteobacteria bacterium]|nr:M55 family metallopeptidase [Pseudomonadota bacterium]
MKVYVSADIEGVTGITAREEGRKDHPDYAEFRNQMTRETAAACDGAIAAGATAVTVKDAHGTGRNLIASELPVPTRLIRGWSGHPFMMVQELDESYAAAVFIGYHSRAGSGGNPLAHTITGAVQEIRINGGAVSEYRIHAMAAALVGVPVVFVSGDRTLCNDVAAFQPATRAFATKWGEGSSQFSLHPAEAEAGIRDGVREALTGDPSAARINLPRRFELEVVYRDHIQAYAKSFYPGATQAGSHMIRLKTDDYFDVLRAFSFLL